MVTDDRLRQERAREVGLFRYSLVRPVADPGLTPGQRGAMVRELAAREHRGPDGRMVKVTRSTIDRWLRAWRQGGFDALVPTPRQVERRTPADVLEMAVALKKEVPARTAVQVQAIMLAAGVVPPSERTLQRHFAALGLRPMTGAPVAFGRFEADRPNELWSGDAMHGPVIDGRKALLFAFIDDHTRVLTGYRWVRREDTIRMEGALRAGIASRGIPETVYVDNGSPFVDGQFLASLARLGVRLVHSRPGQPQGRGKIERFFRTVRDQFLVEVTAPGARVETMDDLSRYFTAWVETVYHTRPHTETSQAPLTRWNTAWQEAIDAGGRGPVLATPAQLHDAFLFIETRTVTKTATVSLQSNIYEVDAALIGRKIDLVFNPFDLTDITVRYDGRDMGKAVPHVLRRHTHPKARPDETPPPAAATGIDYLDLLATRHDQATTAPISFAQILAHPHDDDGDDGEQQQGQGLTDGRIDIVDGMAQPDLWADPTTTDPTGTTTTQTGDAA